MNGGAAVLATIPAILALVNLAKAFGVTGKWSALLAVVLGVGFAQADYWFGATGATATASGAYVAGGMGLVLGLSAAGLYDVASTIAGGYLPKRAVDEVTLSIEPGQADALATLAKFADASRGDRRTPPRGV